MASEEIPPHRDEEYGFMEREVAFKLLAAHGMVDEPFFEYLRKDPVNAAASLHIALNEADVAYLQNEVDWERLASHAPDVRDALKLELVTNSW